LAQGSQFLRRDVEHVCLARASVCRKAYGFFY
jgi:hypothetical protein